MSYIVVLLSWVCLQSESSAESSSRRFRDGIDDRQQEQQEAAIYNSESGFGTTTDPGHSLQYKVLREIEQNDPNSFNSEHFIDRTQEIGPSDLSEILITAKSAATARNFERTPCQLKIRYIPMNQSDKLWNQLRTYQSKAIGWKECTESNYGLQKLRVKGSSDQSEGWGIMSKPQSSPNWYVKLQIDSNDASESDNFNGSPELKNQTSGLHLKNPQARLLPGRSKEWSAINKLQSAPNRYIKLQFDSNDTRKSDDVNGKPAVTNRIAGLHLQKLQVRGARGRGWGIMNKLQSYWGGIRWPSRSKAKGLTPSEVPQTVFNVNRVTKSGGTGSTLNTLERGLAQERVERHARGRQSGDSTPSSAVDSALQEHLRSENNRNPETPYERGLSKYPMSELGSYTYQDLVEPLAAPVVRSKLGSLSALKKYINKPANSGTAGPSETSRGSASPTRRSSSSSSLGVSSSESIASNKGSKGSGGGPQRSMSIGSDSSGKGSGNGAGGGGALDSTATSARQSKRPKKFRK